MRPFRNSLALVTLCGILSLTACTSPAAAPTPHPTHTAYPTHTPAPTPPVPTDTPHSTPTPAPDRDLHVSSPNGRIRAAFLLEDGVPYYAVSYAGQDVIRPSRLGFTFRDAPPLNQNLAVADARYSSFDETWTQPWGEVKDIRNRYNELRVELQETTELHRRMTLVFRVYEYGLGFRYELPEQEHLSDFQIMDEQTEFVLTGDHQAWWIPAYRDNRYEYLYRKSPISFFRTGPVRAVHTPLTIETADGLFLSIHEADLTDYASMTLAGSDTHTLRCDLVPWSDGVKVKGSTPHRSPWRTIQIAESAGDLITSTLILNLNEPNRLGDVSWVRPGKYVGIWWGIHIDKYTWAPGDRHGATTENAKRTIDFAAKYGFSGVLVEGWNVGWDGRWVGNGEQFSFTTPYEDFDLEELSAYAAARDVKLIGHHETGAAVANYEQELEEAFAFYRSLGIDTVKTGYSGWGQEIERRDEDGDLVGLEWHHGQFMVRHYRKVVETAAKYHIMLNVHEPIKDTGIRRTYPNMMTREGARGQEYNAWSEDGGNPPEHTTILPFARMLAGPFDFTPGIFDLLFDEYRPDNRVNTTLAKQLALYVLIYSPLHMAADLPENYEGHPAFPFIVDVPVDWQETRVLHAQIGDYVTIARQERDGEDWYIGSITDENGRTLEAPLTFLEPGQQYVAEVYADGADAHWESAPASVHVYQALVDRDTTLELSLAPGGGQAVRLRPATAAASSFLDKIPGIVYNTNMGQPQIVIDTNVLIAALQSRRGASHKLLMLIDSGKFDCHLSVPLVLEYEEVAKRLLADVPLTEQDIDDILDYLCATGRRQRIFYLWRPFLKDPKDDMVLELAVTANCDFIVTYNKRDFKGVARFGVRVVTPQEFLQEIGELP